MLNHTFEKITRTTKVILASFMGITLSIVPLLAHASNESTDNHATATHTHAAPQIATPTDTAPLTASKPDSSDTSTDQSISREKNSILSLKTGRTLLKTVDVASHLVMLYTNPNNSFKYLMISAGLVGTIATLAESIVKNYETPRKQNNIMRDRVFVFCKLVGVMGHAFLLSMADSPFGLHVAVTVPNLAFLGHSLYGDYKSYVGTEKTVKRYEKQEKTYRLLISE